MENKKLPYKGSFFVCLVLGLRLPEAAPNKADEGDKKENQACCLADLRPKKEGLHIIAAEEFKEKAQRRVEHDVKKAALAAFVRPGLEYDEQRKKDDINLSFPDFCRP